MDTSNIFNTTSIILAALSFIAIIISIIAFRDSHKTTLKVNTKEFQMSESMKYELLEMIAILRAIDQKAAYNQERKGERDYSPEIKRLKELQTKPGFLIFLNSISDCYQKERVTDSGWVEHIIAILCDCLLPKATDDEEDTEEIRLIVHEIIDIVKEHADLKGQFGNEYENLLGELCSLKGLYSQFDYEAANKRSNEKMKYRNFFNYLIEELGCQDPDVLLCRGKNQLMKYEAEQDINKALDLNANADVKVDQIISRYQKELNEYLEKLRYNQFFNYLFYRKKHADVNVLYWYGKTCTLSRIGGPFIKQAEKIGKGKKVQFKEIHDVIQEYKKEYEEFKKLIHNGNK